MKKVLIVTFIVFISFSLLASLFLAKNQASAQVEPPPSVPVPFADITLDGNPSDWTSISIVFTDPESDDPLLFTGADIKSYKVAQDSDFVYLMVDFYDGPPSIDLGQADPFAYQFHFNSLEPNGFPSDVHIDNLGVFYDGEKWDITYLSVIGMPGLVSGSLTGSSVAVGSVIELKVPKNKLPNTFAFCFVIGSGVDGVLGDTIPEWRVLYLVPERILPDEAVELAEEVIQADYLWGGKGYNFNVRKFATPATVKDIGYNYWNPEEGKIDFGKGLDCSGLSFWSYNRAYYEDETINWAECIGKEKKCPIAYEGADGQYRNNSYKIEEVELRPGDLLFFDVVEDKYSTIDHVAMYMGGNEVIHAEGVVFRKVVKENLETVLSRYEEYFKGFGRIKEVKQPELLFTSESPIDLIITDPEGITITREVEEVPGMYYHIFDLNGDGELDDIIDAPERKIGNYLVTVVPEPDALPTDTYTLEVEALVNGELVTIVLAEDIPISDIPEQSYLIKSTETGIIPAVPMKSFTTKEMKIHWALDRPGYHWRDKTSFTISGNFELPDEYKKEDLDKSALFYLQITDRLGKDKVILKELKNLWLYQEPWRGKEIDDSLSQGIDIKAMIVHWLEEKECKFFKWWCKEKPTKNWFYIRGELSLEGVDINTLPREATITLELPMAPDEEVGSLAGIETIEFKKFHHTWFYHLPIKWKDWQDGWWKKWDDDGFDFGRDIISNFRGK